MDMDYAWIDSRQPRRGVAARATTSALGAAPLSSRQTPGLGFGQLRHQGQKT